MMKTRRMHCSPRGEVSLLEGPLWFDFHSLVLGLQSLESDLSQHPRAGCSETGLGCWWAPVPSVGPQCYCGYYYSYKQQ